MPDPDAQQLDLTPSAPIVGEPCIVPLAMIRPPTINLGAPPALEQSIRALGLLEPLLLSRSVPADRYSYQIIAGARRWDACVRIADEDPTRDTVPALVVDLGGWVGADILSAAENEHRRPNIIQTLETLERLYGAGVQPAAVASRLGFSQQSQRRVWRLHALVPELRAAVRNRQLTQAVAELAARLPADEQMTLVADGTRVTAEQVRGMRAVRRSAAIAEMFADLGDEAPSPPPLPVLAPAELGLASEVPSWAVAAVAAIRQAVHAIPPSEFAARNGMLDRLYLTCLVQAAVSLGVDPASRYEILLTPTQLDALRRSGWDEPGRARRVS